MSPVQGAARGRHIRSRLERLNKRIDRIRAYQYGQPLTQEEEAMYPTFRAAKAALKLIPRDVRIGYEGAEKQRIAAEREAKQVKDKAKINSEIPAALHAASKARKEDSRKRRPARRREA